MVTLLPCTRVDAHVCMHAALARVYEAALRLEL
jgi:hypothetical protein